MLLTARSHSLANELLKKPDSFITVTVGNREYIIKDIKRLRNHANEDDYIGYYTLECKETGDGNIKR